MPKYNKCPKCGGEEFTMKQYVCGNGYYQTRFDGAEADNSDLHAYVDYKNLWKYPRCSNCGYKLKDLEV